MSALLNANIDEPDVRTFIQIINLQPWILAQLDAAKTETATLQTEKSTLEHDLDLEKAKATEVEHLRRTVVAQAECLLEKDAKIGELKGQVRDLAGKVKHSGQAFAGLSRQQEPGALRGSGRLASESQRKLEEAEAGLARARRELAEMLAAREANKSKGGV